MNTKTKRLIRDAITRLNDLYGKGKVFGVNFKTNKVDVRIYVTQSAFGRPEYYNFHFDGKTVRFRGHQQKIK
jgi:hypothetical protein